MCAVGWEPNPAHIPALTKLEEAYNRCGWKVNFFNSDVNIILFDCPQYYTKVLT